LLFNTGQLQKNDITVLGLVKSNRLPGLAQPATGARRGDAGFRDQEATGLTRRNHGWLRYFTYSFSDSAQT
jgi:hypothetical protein